MQPQNLFYIIVALTCFGFLLDRLLDYLNMRSWKPELPAELSAYMDAEKYCTAQKYHQEKERLSLYSDTLSFVITLCFLIAGGFGWMSDLLSRYITSPIWMTLVYFGILSVGSSLLGMPFNLYNTFVIEQKYGFNRTSLKTYIIDMLKGSLIGIALGCTLGYFLLWLIMQLGQDFWLYAWLTATVFIVFINYAYTSLIIPLFNKLAPLDAGTLRSNIEDYAGKVRFPLTNILVMNGSKRSTKANAFFSGMGNTRKIVLYDTLIEKHSPTELVAILAHEVGHYKRKHIMKGLFISLLTIGFTLWLLSRFVFSPVLSEALGAHTTSLPVNMIAFGILYGPVSMLTGLIGNILSRKHEYEADAFAAATADKEAFKKALLKLSTDNLSNLQPHPAYVFFHYSHPPVLKRIEALGH